MAAVDHPPVTARTRRLLTTLLVPLLALLVVGAVVVWPTGKATSTVRTQGQLVDARITALRDVTCVDTAPAAGVRCTRPLADLDDGGTVAVEDEPLAPTVEVGDHVVLLRRPDPDGAPTYTLVGYDRTDLVLELLGVGAVLVLLVARRRGLQLLVALAVVGLLLRAFTMPAALHDADPLVLGLVTGGAAAVVLLVVGRRPGARSATALVGTLLGLVVAGLVANVAGARGQLGGVGGELVPRALVVAGIVTAAAGIAAHLAVDVVDGTWDLRDAPTDARWLGVLRAGLTASRDRVTTAVATFALAVVGTSLGLLLPFAAAGAGRGPLASEPTSAALLTALVGVIAVAATALLTAALAALVAVREAGTTAPGDPRKFRAKAERELWEDGA